MNDNLNVVQRIQKVMDDKCMSRKELAAISGLSTNIINSIFFRADGVPKTDSFLMIAKALDVDPYYLCFGETTKQKFEKEIPDYYLLKENEKEIVNELIQSLIKYRK